MNSVWIVSLVNLPQRPSNMRLKVRALNHQETTWTTTRNRSTNEQARAPRTHTRTPSPQQTKRQCKYFISHPDLLCCTVVASKGAILWFLVVRSEVPLSRWILTNGWSLRISVPLSLSLVLLSHSRQNVFPSWFPFGDLFLLFCF